MARNSANWKAFCVGTFQEPGGSGVRPAWYSVTFIDWRRRRRSREPLRGLADYPGDATREFAVQPPPTAADPADTLLVVRCQLGERAAFDALVRRWAPPLQRYALKLTRDAALTDDLVQDIWLRVIRGLGRLRDAAQFRPWLFGIAHRAFADRLRERYALAVEADVDWTAFAAADDGGGEAEDRERALAGGLERLPLVEREVLTLFYLEELPLAEIATALGIPTGTVKSRLFRARALLRHHLTAEE